MNQILSKKFISAFSHLSVLFGIALFFHHSDVSAASKKKLFSFYDVQTPFTITQPIIALNLFNASGDKQTKELVVIGIDDKSNAWLSIYAQNLETEKYVLVDALPIDKKYFAYDTSDTHQAYSNDEAAGQEISKLYFLSSDEVVSYLPNLSNKKESVLTSQKFLDSMSSFKVEQKTHSMYLVKSSTYLSRKDFIKDLNHDDIDDIVLDDFKQLNVWMSNKDSTNKVDQFQLQSLDITPIVALNRDGVTFSPQVTYYGDFNFDQLEDIAWVEQGKLKYFAQEKEGRFSSESKTVELHESISGINWWQVRTADGEGLDQSELVYRMVEKIQDVNGDGILDIIVRYTQSSGVLDRSNNYEFYFGQKLTSTESLEGNESNTQNEIALNFSKTANTTIEADGTLTGLSVLDINNDDRFEILLSSFELSVGNIIGALISGGIDQNVLLFSLNKDDEFSEKPIAEKDVELSFSLSKGQSGSPVVILADVNADGLKDLVLSDDDTLKVYKGLKNNRKRKFAKKPIKQDLPIPKEGSRFLSYDINNDNKNDFVVSYGRLDEPEMQKIFSVIMAK